MWLSDAFINEDRSGEFEWTARVVNIGLLEDDILAGVAKDAEWLDAESAGVFGDVLWVRDLIPTAAEVLENSENKSGDFR